MESSKRPTSEEHDREDEATSTETVADLEESEKGSPAKSSDSGPSPDGAMDETGELEKANPV